MDDDGSGRTLTGGFFIFIRPAAIIGHRAATERALQILLFIVRIVDQDDDGFALHIKAGIIIPAPLRRVDAKAHKHNIAVLNVCLGRDAIAGSHKIRLIGKIERRLAARELQPHIGAGCHPHHRHILKPAALIGRL